MSTTTEISTLPPIEIAYRNAVGESYCEVRVCCIDKRWYCGYSIGYRGQGMGFNAYESLPARQKAYEEIDRGRAVVRGIIAMLQQSSTFVERIGYEQNENLVRLLVEAVKAIPEFLQTEEISLPILLQILKYGNEQIGGIHECVLG